MCFLLLFYCNKEKSIAERTGELKTKDETIAKLESTIEDKSQRIASLQDEIETIRVGL